MIRCYTKTETQLPHEIRMDEFFSKIGQTHDRKIESLRKNG